MRPPRGGRTLRRRPARLAACVLIAALGAVLAAPAASAATASPPSSTAGRVVLADPVPSPSPNSTGPGIGLGPGAPTGAVTAPSPITTSGPSTGGGSDPSWYDIPGQIEKAINDWFASIAASALTPMLDLLGATLLGTPDVTVMSGVTRIWTQMALLANALYILIVLAGAVIVTTHGTVQSRFSAKEVVPRLAVGMIAGNASLGLIALMIRLANAVATAILGNTISPATAGAALGHQLSTQVLGGGGIFLVLLLLGGLVMLVAILLTYIIRVAITVILAVAAPLALSMHALPGADGMARMWWRAMTGCLLIQLGQSLAFVVALDVMLDPNANVSILGLPNNNAWVDPLVFIALCWILIKIPTWVGRSMLGISPGSGLMRIAKAAIAYKTLGMLGMKKGPGGFPIRRKTGAGPNRPRPTGGAGGATRGGGPKPAPGGGGWGAAASRTEPATAGGRRRSVSAPSASASAGQGPRLAPDGTAPASMGSATGEAVRTRAGSHHQMPIPIPGGGRKQLEARATPGDHRLARNALSRPEQPTTWLEDREAERRRLARGGGAREAPATPGGPRFRQEALFPRSPARMNPTTPTAKPAATKPTAPAPTPASPTTRPRAGGAVASPSARAAAGTLPSASPRAATTRGAASRESRNS
ncbi:hypothetical protein KDK95_30945 [Actinospica sp. MGRD01-02]|uniref:Uncharacterized protein n=1 Tax=Actinospica acidithermotolerans TaxID=2828514 RepID=A0A941EFZ7_9ACTN|nr:hypothetical protein [Actinospica acidithermotolerans]MBR7830761.1 hypothetical protein [Actinospica acidithermotolerans]